MALALSASALSAPSTSLAKTSRRVVVTKAAATGEENVVINPAIEKESDKVATAVNVGDLTKPVTAYCRCWRSKTFPLCDGTHMAHNKATGDNVGPLVLKK